MDKPKVLYVDDQEGNLVVFRSSLRKHLEIRLASSGEEGLALLKEEEIPVVIADQRMPGMSGSDFLAEVRRLYPDTMRMVMTAYTNFEDVVKAINDGWVTKFFSKPWDREEVLTAVTNATRLYHQTRENRHLTAKLLHQQRLAAIGQVTSGLVHELSNIGSVLSIAEDIEDSIKAKEDVGHELRILKSAVEKFGLLVENLRVFSKGGEDLTVVRQSHDLNEVVDSALRLLKLFDPVRTLKSLKYTPIEGGMIVPVDLRRIEQVLINLVKNAAEACPAWQGIVRIDADRTGDTVHLRVTDNGPGIPEDVGSQVWEGFYSTKGTIGTGLGLMMCRKIMHAHGGDIAYENNADGGCTFTLTLPLG